MTKIPNRFGTSRPAEGTRVDMNFRAVEIRLDSLEAELAALEQRVAALESP